MYGQKHDNHVVKLIAFSFQNQKYLSRCLHLKRMSYQALLWKANVQVIVLPTITEIGFTENYQEYEPIITTNAGCRTLQKTSDNNPQGALSECEPCGYALH